ncbi:MAG: GH32 C-terminal domain-containing protein, partial [Muribaculaceae bacterium]|nr:GH32 C-terminal domain-containing protein [Muribaculaceae bacterium]
MQKLTSQLLLAGSILMGSVLPAGAANVSDVRFGSGAFADSKGAVSLNIDGRFNLMEIGGYATGTTAWRTDGYSSRAAGRLKSNILNGNQMSATLRFALDTYPIIGHENGTTDKVDIAGCLNEGAKSGFAFRISRTGEYSALLYVGGNLVEVPVGGKIPLWEWTELTLTYDGSAVKLFKNSQEVGRRNASGNVKVGDTELKFAIGDRHADLGGAEICGINGAYESLTIDDTATVPAFTPKYANLAIPANRYANDRLRARFHGQPGQNWSNETHGLIYHNGKYHAFYQKTGSAPIMSHQHWGHIVSNDLITWQDEKPVLAPSEYYDIKGCWSGCVFKDEILNGGNPTIIYTGVDFAKPYVATAFCIDQENMRNWQKDPSNPIAALTETPVGDGRDTYFYRDGNNAYFLVGARDAVYYFQWDGSKWNYKGEFYHTQDGVDNGHNTEMPNVTHMGGGKWLMTTSPLAGRYGTTCLYRVGSLNDGKFVNYSDAERVDFFGCDGYGLLSPSIGTTPDGRIVALGIVPDKMPTQVNIDLGYAHLYSLPREWSLDGAGKLLQKPAKEIYAHRDLSSKFALADKDLDGYVSLENVRGRAAEVSATFVTGDSPFGFTFYKNSKGKGGSLTYNPATGEIVFDMKDLPRLQDDMNKNRFSSILPIRPAKGEDFKMQMFIDHSIIDIFINDRYAASVRVYPTDDDSDLIEVFAQGPT